jgi:hypothetical protein
MPRPSRTIIKIIKRYQTDHEIIRFKRNNDEYIPAYVGGIAQPRDFDRVAIKGHHQPISDGKLIKSLDEGQRLEDMKKWWTLDATKPKDKIIIDGFIYTVNAAKEWTNYTPVFTEADLLRTGEADNID